MIDLDLAGLRSLYEAELRHAEVSRRRPVMHITGGTFAALLAAAEQLEAAMRVVETARAFREQAVHGAKLTAVTELDDALAALDQLRGKE